MFLNFDIIELTFAKEGKYTVIPVVNNPIDIYNDITLPKVENPWGWLETLIAIILVVLLIIVLWVTGLLPAVVKGIVWLLILPFGLIGKLFKAIFKKIRKRPANKSQVK